MFEVQIEFLARTVPFSRSQSWWVEKPFSKSLSSGLSEEWAVRCTYKQKTMVSMDCPNRCWHNLLAVGAGLAAKMTETNVFLCYFGD